MILQLACAGLSLVAAIWAASTVSSLSEAVKELAAQRQEMAENEAILDVGRKEANRIQAENISLVHKMNQALRKGE